MTPRRSHFQGTFYALLALHVGKIEIEGILLFVKLLAGINDGRLIILCSVEETDHIGQTIHPVDVEVIDDSRFPRICLRHNESFELLGAGSDGYGQGAADGL